jgi:hypothetical protein
MATPLFVSVNNQQHNNAPQTGRGKDRMRYELKNQHCKTISTHRTHEAAEAKRQRLLAWRCGICGNDKGGWGRCSHGTHNRVCSAEHYNNYIEQVG